MNTQVSSDLQHQFLIAMPGLNDPNFDHALIYLCDHDTEGSMGLVINQASDVSTGELLDSLELLKPETDVSVRSQPVYCGGPVRKEQGFILHRDSKKPWLGTEQLADNLFITATKDILQDIANNQGPEQFLIILGYSGWGAGQLEEEIQDNAWLNAPADNRILFESQDQHRWQQAISSLGFNPEALSHDAGHA